MLSGKKQRTILTELGYALELSTLLLAAVLDTNALDEIEFSELLIAAVLELYA